MLEMLKLSLSVLLHPPLARSEMLRPCLRRRRTTMSEPLTSWLWLSESDWRRLRFTAICPSGEARMSSNVRLLPIMSAKMLSTGFCMPSISYGSLLKVALQLELSLRFLLYE